MHKVKTAFKNLTFPHKNMLKHFHGWGLNFTCIASGLLSSFSNSDKEKIRDEVDYTGYISHRWHESNSNALLRCQTWRLSFRFNSLILLVHNKAGSRVEEKGAFVMLIKKQKVKNVNNDGWKWQVWHIREQFFVCLVKVIVAHMRKGNTNGS